MGEEIRDPGDPAVCGAGIPAGARREHLRLAGSHPNQQPLYVAERAARAVSVIRPHTAAAYLCQGQPGAVTER